MPVPVLQPFLPNQLFTIPEDDEGGAGENTSPSINVFTALRDCHMNCTVLEKQLMDGIGFRVAEAVAVLVEVNGLAWREMEQSTLPQFAKSSKGNAALIQWRRRRRSEQRPSTVQAAVSTTWAAVPEARDSGSGNGATAVTPPCLEVIEGVQGPKHV